MTNNFPIIKILLDNNHVTKEYYFDIFREALDQNKDDYDRSIRAYYRSIYCRLDTILEITQILIDEERSQYLMNLILEAVEYQNFTDKEQIMPIIEKLLAMDAKIPDDMIMHVSYDIFLQNVSLDMAYDESFIDKCMKYGSLDIIVWITKYLDQYNYDVAKMAIKTFPLLQNYPFDYYLKKLDHDDELNYVFFNLCLCYDVCVEYIYERWKNKNWVADDAVSLLILICCLDRRLVEKNICDHARKYMDKRYNLKKKVVEFLTINEHYQNIKYMYQEKKILEIEKYNEHINDANALFKIMENINFED
uniref:Uncharacterized protein n=1 Tax=viral metagenome TaxID=1070528 RepID=A0A6C0C867_9ZZZZ